MTMFIKKSVIEDRGLSDEAFAVYCALRTIVTADKKEYFISYNYIADILYCRLPARREVEAIKKGFTELVNNEEIAVLYAYSKAEYRVNLEKLYYQQGSGYFSDITHEEMRQILAIDTTVNKYKLLRYYACMVSTFNRSNSLDVKYRGKIGGMSYECFTELLGLSKPTICKYNEILMESNILYVINGEYYNYIENGVKQVRQYSNTYSRYKDKDIATEFNKRMRGSKEESAEGSFLLVKNNDN